MITHSLRELGRYALSKGKPLLEAICQLPEGSTHRKSVLPDRTKVLRQEKGFSGQRIIADRPIPSILFNAPLWVHHVPFWLHEKALVI